jgi:hypothetical protein
MPAYSFEFVYHVTYLELEVNEINYVEMPDYGGVTNIE